MISKLHGTIGGWLVILIALLLAGCATEPADAQPAAAPSAVIETTAPAEDAQASVTPEPTGEALTVSADDALLEGPDRLAALDDPRGAEGALLTPEQLADSASAFAQFTGLEGLTASQPELREGAPDFLARTIVFVNSEGELVGMVVADDKEVEQLFLWIGAKDENGDGAIVVQYTDGSQPLEGEARAAAIADYWTAYLDVLQQAAAAEQEAAEVEQHAPVTNIRAVPIEDLGNKTESGWLQYGTAISKVYRNNATPELRDQLARYQDTSMIVQFDLLAKDGQSRTIHATMTIPAYEEFLQAADPAQLPWLEQLRQAVAEQQLPIGKNTIAVTSDAIWLINNRTHQSAFSVRIDRATGDIQRFGMSEIQSLTGDRVPKVGGALEYQERYSMVVDVANDAVMVHDGLVKLYEWRAGDENSAGEWQLFLLPYQREGAVAEIQSPAAVATKLAAETCDRVQCPVPFGEMEQRSATVAGIEYTEVVGPDGKVVMFVYLDTTGQPRVPILTGKYGDKHQEQANFFEPLSVNAARLIVRALRILERMDAEFLDRLWQQGRVGLIANGWKLRPDAAGSHSRPLWQQPDHSRQQWNIVYRVHNPAVQNLDLEGFISTLVQELFELLFDYHHEVHRDSSLKYVSPVPESGFYHYIEHSLTSYAQATNNIHDLLQATLNARQYWRSLSSTNEISQDQNQTISRIFDQVILIFEEMLRGK